MLTGWTILNTAEIYRFHVLLEHDFPRWPLTPPMRLRSLVDDPGLSLVAVDRLHVLDTFE
jgi:hypothetical protein